ncbi:MAG: hypothetical protein ACRD0U_02160 [Acidimicrobiales bacterium]
MLNWQPNWEDVVFDLASAQEAVIACTQAAGELDSVLTGLTAGRRRIETDGAWRGDARLAFNDEAGAIVREAVQTRDALNRLTGRILGASADAQVEQSRRVADRARWRQERDQEVAAQGGLRPRQGPF